jgi:hypothetical protein
VTGNISAFDQLLANIVYEIPENRAPAVTHRIDVYDGIEEQLTPDRSLLQ